MPASSGTVSGQHQESPSSEGSSSARDVFISYASQDRAIADSVVENLEQHGVKCWIAPRDVTPGSRYADEIVGAINECKVLVLVLSEHAIASPHVGREIERAASKRRRIVGLRTDAAPLTRSFEYFLSESQWIDTAALGMPAALAKLTQAVRQGLAPSSWLSPGLGTDVRNTADRNRRPSYRTIKRVIAAAVFLVGVLIVVGVMVRYWPSKQAVLQVPAVAAISAKSVAVLPFVDMSEKKDQEYFSDGMSEELIDMLAKIPDLRVPARTSSFYFKGKPTTIADIARALGVAYVLEGSVRKSGNVLRVTAQLIRVDTGYHLWSETYDRQLYDVFKVQDDIADAVVKALKVALVGESQAASVGTQNVDAYNLYLQARAIYQHAADRQDYVNVVDYLHKALELDPQFSNAWVLLSVALTVQAEDRFLSADQVEGEARAASQHALEHNPRLPEAHVAAARILLVDDLDTRAAEQHIRQAIELAPNDPWALSYVAELASRRGEFDKAIDAIRKSIVADPVNPNRYQDLAGVLYYGRKYPESLKAYRKMIDLNPGITGENAQLFDAQILLASGKPQAALAEMDREKAQTVEGAGSLVSHAVLLRALAYDNLGRKEEANTQLAEMETHHSKDMPFAIALVYANRGKMDEAFGWFEAAYRLRDNGLVYLKVDPLLKNVQSDPRFNQLLNKLGLQD